MSRIRDQIYVAVLAQEGIPAPVREHRFHPVRRWRFDFAWPLQKIAVEVEGGVWTRGRHTRPSGFVRDMEKYNTAAALGWRVLRVEPKHMRSRDHLEKLKVLFQL